MSLGHATRADLESLLRARQLDRTLTTALPPIDPHDEYAIGPTSVARLDEALGGGFPRGQLSEIVGARSSGRASLLVRLLAAATARGELVALVDVLDMFDVESAEAVGVDLSHLLWVRGHVAAHSGPGGLPTRRDSNRRAMEQAIRALALVLGAGNFGLVAFDAGEAPADAFRQLSFTTWLRLQRMIEGRQTIVVLVGTEPMARSSAGLTVRLCRAGLKAQGSGLQAQGEQGNETWPGAPAAMPSGPARGISVSTRRGWGPGVSEEKLAGIRFGSQLFDGLDIEAHVIRARTRVREDTMVALTTAMAAEP